MDTDKRNKTDNCSWKLAIFHTLTLEELYAIMQLRMEVFVVEQNCVYLDLDGKDAQCHHLMCFEQTTGKLLAYTRILPAGLGFFNPSIGPGGSFTQSQRIRTW